MKILQFLTLHSGLFYIGVAGIIINRTNLIKILISLELMILSVALNFLFISFFSDDVMGEIFAIIILTVAAAESAIALAIIIRFFKKKKNY